MKVRTLEIHWHEQKPIYSVHFQPTGKGRLATAGGDANIRVRGIQLWKFIKTKDEPVKVECLTTLSRHTGAVNVVRFSPNGEVLASAGDDGNVMFWVHSEKKEEKSDFQLATEEHGSLETWKIRSMTRGMNSEIYDLAWSPDGDYIITGSMDNTARIFNGQDGQCLRQIVDHSHYVQGVAWDPLAEFVATQSSDRSVHIYQFRGKGNDISIKTLGRNTKLENFHVRTESGRVKHASSAIERGRAISPSPSATSDTSEIKGGNQILESVALPSPVPSQSPAPCHITSTSTPALSSKDSNNSNNNNHQMQPPPNPPSRRSSFSTGSEARRSVSPLPAVRSPAKSVTKSFRLYHDDTLVSFFRRLTFTPDGSLLLTPAGQFRSAIVNKNSNVKDGTTCNNEYKHTVYIYIRSGLTKQPVAHLPGHKLPSIAVRCSPIIYEKRETIQPTIRYSIERGSSLPSSGTEDIIEQTTAFSLPYRMIYAVATQDTVLIYDTQQQSPLCILGNLHYATFTDLAWSSDGLTLVLSSTDGYCSIVTFEEGELGTPYKGIIPSRSAVALENATSLHSIGSIGTGSGKNNLSNVPPFPTPRVPAKRPDEGTAPVTIENVSSSKSKDEMNPVDISAPTKKRRLQLTFEGPLK